MEVLNMSRLTTEQLEGIRKLNGEKSKIDICNCANPKRHVTQIEGEDRYYIDVICLKCDKLIYR